VGHLSLAPNGVVGRRLKFANALGFLLVNATSFWGVARAAPSLAGQFEVGLLRPVELLGELEFPCEVVISRLAELGAGRV
jgi:hypothetical protein